MKKEKLHIIAPILSEISLKKNAFKVPDNYFSTIEDDVVATINLKNLLSINSTSNFIAPNHYFDTIEEITITKLKAEVIQTKEKSQLYDGYFDTIELKISGPKQPKVIPLKNNFIRILSLSIAASILLFFGLKYMNTGENTQNQLVFQPEEFANWIEFKLFIQIGKR